MTAASLDGLSRIDCSSAMVRPQLLELVAQLLAVELGEPAELHVEDVLRLHVGELERRDHQAGLGALGVFGAADQGDDGVDHVERLHQALDDVLALLRLAETELGAPLDDLLLVLDVDRERRLEVEQLRHVVDQRQHVHREVGLHRRVLVEQVQHDLRVGVALELDDEARGVARRLVAHVADAFDLAVVDQLGDLLADHLDRGLVRHLGDRDAHVALAALLDLGDRAHLDGAATGRVGVVDPAAPEDQRAGREVGTLHELHEVDDRRVGVLEQVLHRVDHLPEVVRRDVRRHTDGDPASSVDQEVGKSRGEHDGLDGVAVVGGREVDGVLVDLPQQLHRQRRQPRFGVVVDEAGGEEGVVVGVDPDREHRLHAGVGDRLDGGEVPTARDERGDDLLHLERRDVRRGSRGRRRSQSAMRSKLCFSSHFLSAPRRRSRPARTRRGTGCGRRRCSTARREARRGSRSSFSCLAPQNPTRRANRRASRRLPITSLISPFGVLGPPADDPELEQQVLHVACELLAAGGVRDLDGVLAEVRQRSRRPRTAPGGTPASRRGRACHTNSGTRLSALFAPVSAARALCAHARRVLDVELVQRLARRQRARVDVARVHRRPRSNAATTASK